MTSPLERLRPLIDDWAAFLDAVGRPEPTTVRANTLRISPTELTERLAAQGFTTEPVPGVPELLRILEQPRNPSDTLEHWAGLMYIQQASTAVAAPLLGARPGERVLDLCAAPGGKTTHLAELMEGEGALVAAEVNEGRIRGLLGNLYRLGHTGVQVVAADGRTFPDDVLFDRVLVDVPCSAQGTIRKKRGRLPERSRSFLGQVTRAQEKLLRRAIRLTRPGGTVLYVTCTFGPEENEGIVSRVLADAPVELDPIELGVPHARGLTVFEGRALDPRMEGAVRIYPHHLDSGGLFACRLRVLDDGSGRDPEAGWSPVPDVFPGDDPAGARADIEAADAILEEAWGVDRSALDGRRWMRRGSNLWLHGCSTWPVEGWEPGGHWRLIALGLRAMDLGGDGPPRATNDLLQLLDDAVTRRRVALSRAEWRALLDGEEVRAEEGPEGYAALVLEGMVVGWGFVRDGVIRPHVPKGRASWLRKVLADDD